MQLEHVEEKAQGKMEGNPDEVVECAYSTQGQSCVKQVSLPAANGKDMCFFVCECVCVCGVVFSF